MFLRWIQVSEVFDLDKNLLLTAIHLVLFTPPLTVPTTYPSSNDSVNAINHTELKVPSDNVTLLTKVYFFSQEIAWR